MSRNLSTFSSPATYASHTVIGRWGQPPEVGSVVAFLASDAASYVSGSTMLIDAGWTAIDGPPTGLTQVGRPPRQRGASVVPHRARV